MSQGLLCLDCWRLTPPLEALAECVECARPGADSWLRVSSEGLRARDYLPPWWRRALGGGRPRCEDHPRASLALRCDCGRPLTTAAASKNGAGASEGAAAGGLSLSAERRFAVGLAGAPGAGKTLLLAAMIRTLNHWRAPEAGALGLGDTQARFQPVLDGLFRQGERPDPTVPGQERRHYAWEVLMAGRNRRARSSRVLAVYDTGGEAWQGGSGADEPELSRYLGHLSSVALLIDGAALAADLGLEAGDAWSGPWNGGGNAVGGREEEVLSKLIQRLGAASRQVRLALVVTKADQLWGHPEFAALKGRGAESEAPSEAAHDSGGTATDEGTIEGPARGTIKGPAKGTVKSTAKGADSRRNATAESEAVLREILSRTGRGNLILHGEHRFRQVALFAASGIGFRPGPDDVGEDGRLTTPPNPRGVVEPLLWLLDLRTFRS